MTGALTGAELLERLAAERLMPIVRSTSAADAIAIGRVLIDAGYRLLEVSLTTPGALEAIAELVAVAAATGETVEVGSGTTLSSEDVAAAQAAGASFVVTPAVTESIAAAASAGLPVLAGALTPTEILAVCEAGATAVKLFPADLGGPAYFSALRAPFPDIPLVPVGGVTLETGRDYLMRGALALGLGSPLTGSASAPLDFIALAERAVAFRTMAGVAR